MDEIISIQNRTRLSEPEADPVFVATCWIACPQCRVYIQRPGLVDESRW